MLEKTNDLTEAGKKRDNMQEKLNNSAKGGLLPYLSPAGAWAFALGTSVGWGSLVVTSSSYLSKGGPLGSVLGLLIGAVVMIIISKNYNYLINCYPDSGGAYAYAKETLGYDHGFLTAWFLVLTYFTMLWANATSLPLFAHYFLGDTFKFGVHYSILGYEVYFGEAFLSIAAIIVIMLLCMNFKKAASRAMIVMAVLFSVVIVVCFIAAMAGRDASAFPFEPSLLPDTGAIRQVIGIAIISPWAFIGFESISHATEEFSFKRKKAFCILTTAIISSTVLYIFVTLLSITAFPEGYQSWTQYIADLGNLRGITGIPAFYAAQYYLGKPGIVMMSAALLALVLTSLIGNTMALSRLIYALSKDKIIPARFAKLSGDGIPSNAVMLVAGISVFIPFLGRTTIGWIVDVTTLGAVIIYGYVSASAAKLAKKRGDKPVRTSGAVGIILMIIVGLYLLVPNFMSDGAMATESYILFTVWAVLGFVFFRHTLKNDKEKRFGKSTVVWIALLSLMLFTSLVWMNQANVKATSETITHVREYYSIGEQYAEDESRFIEHEMSELQNSNMRSMMIVVLMFAVSVAVLLNNYYIMRKRAEASETELGNVKSMANRDPLTGVKSKHAYAESEKKLDMQIETGSIEQFSVVVCDVNGLKYINDTFGHKAGDAYIRSASIMICDVFQHSPVFRVGGDEFVIFLTGRDYNNRHELVSKMNEKAEANITAGDVVVAVGMSDYIKDKDKNTRDVFERADALMYDRKKKLKEMGAHSR
ncbi:MAG: amino acid permease [Clostridia bacterium]|nr:amino acid permease [Clostridia bacterium]